MNSSNISDDQLVNKMLFDDLLSPWEVRLPRSLAKNCPRYRGDSLTLSKGQILVASEAACSAQADTGEQPFRPGARALVATV